jgi:exosortase/archaeosortase family protein
LAWGIACGRGIEHFLASLNIQLKVTPVICMNESYEQFIARIDKPGKPLPVWGSALIFLVVFFILQMSYDTCRGTPFEHFILGDMTVAPTARLINMITPDIGVRAVGNQLKAAGGGITVLKGCEGTEIMFMLVAAFAAVVMPWRLRLVGLSIGVLMVFCLNQIRLVGLFYAYRSDASLFDLLHGTVAPIVLVIIVALYTLFWFQYALGNTKTNDPAGA